MVNVCGKKEVEPASVLKLNPNTNPTLQIPGKKSAKCPTIISHGDKTRNCIAALLTFLDERSKFTSCDSMTILPSGSFGLPRTRD